MKARIELHGIHRAPAIAFAAAFASFHTERRDRGTDAGIIIK